MHNTISNLMFHTATTSEPDFVERRQWNLTVLPEVAGDGLGLAGRLAEPPPHLAEHVLHGVHRICKTAKPHHTRASQKRKK